MQKKRDEILEAIKLICEAFNIKDYDYEIRETGQREVLRIGETRIACSDNSTSAVVDELIGYLFITRWCRNRHLGHFGTQAKNIIKKYWLD